jgi:hypothetical protein
VDNDLASTDEPQPGEDHVDLKARTAYGDITIRRAATVGPHRGKAAT